MSAPLARISGCWRTGPGTPAVIAAVGDLDLQPALRRAGPVGDRVQPAAHAVDAKTPVSGNTLQVLGSLDRGHELQVPGILGGPLELDIVEPTGESEQHPRRRRDPQPVLTFDDLCAVDPRAARRSQPIWQRTAPSSTDDHVDRPLRHAAQPVATAGGRSVEEAVDATEQLGGHRSLAKCRWEVGQLDDPRQHDGEHAALLRSADRSLRNAQFDELAHRGHAELAGEQAQRWRSIKDATGQGVLPRLPWASR